MLLAVVVNRVFKDRSFIAHMVSPAVPPDATNRVEEFAKKEDWQLKILKSGEFEDENYLKNPANRCYFCKINVYDKILKNFHNGNGKYQILSGANLDDLGEYRPGLDAAKKYQVRHPYLELNINKKMIRQIAGKMHLSFSELPASPCLSSRVYTGTPITQKRLEAVHNAEQFIRDLTGIKVIRARIRENRMLLEVLERDRKEISEKILTLLRARILKRSAFLSEIDLDTRPYQSGRAFLHKK